jgi:two-component system, OmpR family, response regulator
MTGVKDQRPNRVLVIEDVEAIRIAVDSGLIDAGHTVLLRPDGGTLERDLAEFRPDVVILDVMLPGRDGFALSRSGPGTITGRVW